MSGIRCDNEEHLRWETDGTVVCQHCYTEARATIERLRAALERAVEIARSQSLDQDDIDELTALAASPKGSDPRLECEPARQQMGDPNARLDYSDAYPPPCPDCERNAPVLEAVREWMRQDVAPGEMCGHRYALYDAARAAGLGEE